MNPIDIPAIEAQARRLRAAEIQRINGLFADAPAWWQSWQSEALPPAQWP